MSLTGEKVEGFPANKDAPKRDSFGWLETVSSLISLAFISLAFILLGIIF